MGEQIAAGKKQEQQIEIRGLVLEEVLWALVFIHFEGLELVDHPDEIESSFF